MSGSLHKNLPGGFTLVEVSVTLAVLAILVTGSLVGAGAALDRQQGRGAAQVCQAASAWAQSKAIWSGASTSVKYCGGSVAVSAAATVATAKADLSAPVVDASANVARWQVPAGITWTFSAPFASPDSGGSLYFGSATGRFRIVVRPESGVAARELVAPQ